MIALVRAQRFDPHACMQRLVGLDLLQRHDRLRLGKGIMDREVGAQTVPVFHQNVTAKAQLRLLAVGFAIEHAFRIGGALVRVVAPLFPTEVDREIAGVFVLGRLDFLGVCAVLADEALQAGPRFDERAIGGEVVVDGPAGLAGEGIHFGEEFSDAAERTRSYLAKTLWSKLPSLNSRRTQPEQIATELPQKPFAAHAVTRSTQL